ncbi:hypothetical protein CHU92_00220 [Flavobacterium cyanobacteriorum]|uniref:HTH araC/xylS-type domain-containing protein n=1 Tax=Flavobacterium cyanobacteriorum TaxID=2022802 RepID=A0A256A8B1_9FLAO|nr:AraC family transcriptional regulator [Flavobacterium cyanobacteriorum]OYQ49913.1 hypothetical protein CHU92_00220 [Flavobacterium cyanobacteriorum]
MHYFKLILTDLRLCIAYAMITLKIKFLQVIELTPFIWELSGFWTIIAGCLLLIICIAFIILIKIIMRQQKMLSHQLKNAQDQYNIENIDQTGKVDMHVINNRNKAKKIKATKRKAFRQKDYEYIIHTIKYNKLYLNPDLTIMDVATSCNMPYKKISQLVNHYHGKNFNNLINQMRIEEALRIIEDPDKKNLTLEAIAHEAGFNSKSVFNAFFKQLTSVTPSNYRKKM